MVLTLSNRGESRVSSETCGVTAERGISAALMRCKKLTRPTKSMCGGGKEITP